MESLCYRLYLSLEILMVVIDFNKGTDNNIPFNLLLILHFLFICWFFTEFPSKFSLLYVFFKKKKRKFLFSKAAIERRWKYNLMLFTRQTQFETGYSVSRRNSSLIKTGQAWLSIIILSAMWSYEFNVHTLFKWCKQPYEIAHD